MSVAPGVVIGVRDGFVDNVPVGSLPPTTLDNVGGNYVVVDSGGHFAFYAHLQPGSLTVQVGDRVRAGQVLGLLGNSGNTDFPHLHFHVMNGPSPLASDGLPFEFRSFASPGSIANPDQVLAGQPAEFDPTLAGPHSRQIPMNLQAVTFPEPPR
jgi:murein DD-endopeptidase MepM/ murein hydrolase activator NlpD